MLGPESMHLTTPPEVTRILLTVRPFWAREAAKCHISCALPSPGRAPDLVFLSNGDVSASASCLPCLFEGASGTPLS